MPVKFNDPIVIDGGMEQFSIYNYFTDWTGDDYDYLDIKTSVPAPSSYIMFMVEAVGYVYGNAKPIRCAWNAYTYFYDIGNINMCSNPGNYVGLTPWSVYSGEGYMCLKARGIDIGKGAYTPIGGYIGFTLNAYPTAGNGYGYPISIISSVLNNFSSNYYAS